MKTTTKNLQTSHAVPTSHELELAFAYKVRLALDEQIADLPESTTNRLSAARRMAVARKKQEVPQFELAPARRLAGAFSNGFSNPFDGSLNWFGRVGIIIPLLVLVIGSIGIYQYEEQRRIDDLAELDTAVLTDELPINAYLDHGFDVFLSKHEHEHGE